MAANYWKWGRPVGANRSTERQLPEHLDFQSQQGDRARKGYISPFYYYDFTMNNVRYTDSTKKKSKPETREVESEKRREARAGWPLQEVKPIRFSAFADEYIKGSSPKSVKAA